MRHQGPKHRAIHDGVAALVSGRTAHAGPPLSRDGERFLGFYADLNTCCLWMTVEASLGPCALRVRHVRSYADGTHLLYRWCATRCTRKRPISGPSSNRSVYNSSSVCNCTSACVKNARAPSCRSPYQPCGAGGARSHPFDWFVGTSSSGDGPWNTSILPTAGHGDSNMACWINKTGAVNCNGRGGGIMKHADDWTNYSSWGPAPFGTEVTTHPVSVCHGDRSMCM